MAAGQMTIGRKAWPGLRRVDHTNGRTQSRGRGEGAEATDHMPSWPALCLVAAAHALPASLPVCQGTPSPALAPATHTGASVLAPGHGPGACRGPCMRYACVQATVRQWHVQKAPAAMALRAIPVASRRVHAAACSPRAGCALSPSTHPCIILRSSESSSSGRVLAQTTTSLLCPPAVPARGHSRRPQ